MPRRSLAAVDLDVQADRILRAHGSSDLILWERKEVFAPFEPTPGALYHRHRAAARQGCALPNPKIHKTIGAPPAKNPLYTCLSCGRPSSGLTCRECVTAASIQRELDELRWKQKRIDAHLARYALGLEYALMVLISIEPDFAPLLIERIAAREQQIGAAAFWPKEETTCLEV